MKIICVGLSKTGTTSIKKALEILGYENTISWSEKAAVLYNKKRFDLIFNEYMENYDVFTDRPFTTLYKIFDTLYADCKFIYTERDAESWYKSLKNHVMSSQRSFENFKLIYPFDICDKEKLIAYFNKWHEDVIYYFQHRKDFLFMDVFIGDGWNKLCRFLDREIPEVNFPFVNKGIEFNPNYKG